jgi:hypothetical protein
MAYHDESARAPGRREVVGSSCRGGGAARLIVIVLLLCVVIVADVDVLYFAVAVFRG